MERVRQTNRKNGDRGIYNIEIDIRKKDGDRDRGTGKQREYIQRHRPKYSGHITDRKLYR